MAEELKRLFSDEKADELIEAISGLVPLDSISDGVKSALLACIQNVAWSNQSGQSYYDALYNALYSGGGSSKWDYEWYASSGNTPPEMTGIASYDFTTKPGTMKLAGGKLTFPITDENTELEITCYGDTYLGDSSAPSFWLTKPDYRTPGSYIRGGIRFAVQANNQYIAESIVNAGGAFTTIDYRPRHVYSLSYYNGYFSLKVDGEIALVGAGMTGGTATSTNGFTSQSYATCYLESIKYRRIE